jgi:putative transposase
MELGTNVSEKLGRMYKGISVLQKERKNTYSKIVTNEIRKRFIKIKNIVKDLHYKTITKLMKYDIILLPILKISKNFSKSTKRILRGTSASLFNNRLKNKAEISNKMVYNCDERFTTMNCGRCFQLTKIGKSKEYKCKECGLLVDRDHNGSRNILIRQLEKLEKLGRYN